METEPEIGWLDALLRKVFRTPIPSPVIIEKLAEPPFLPYEIDLVARLRQEIASLEDINSQLHEANRGHVEVTKKWEAAFNAVMDVSGELSKKTQYNVSRRLTRILGRSLRPHQAKPLSSADSITIRF